MKDIEFPILEDESSSYPVSEGASVCPVCKAKEISGEKERAFIHGGAILLGEASDNGTQKFQLIDELQAFLYFDWESGNQDKYAELELATAVKKGQFNFTFCSTTCLRSFLNSCVDNLENRIRKEKNA